MLSSHWKRIAVGFCTLISLCASTGAQTFVVDGGGNVDATSFTGDGSGLTGVPTELHHGFFEAQCAAGSTCFVVSACPVNFEITGGGFFLSSTDQALRKQVTLHQTYRFSATQWAVEATNSSGTALAFFAITECSRVSQATPPPPPVPGGPDFSRTLLACPEWDLARFVEPDAAHDAHFCPHHGEALRPFGGGPGPIPLEPNPASEGSIDH